MRVQNETRYPFAFVGFRGPKGPRVACVVRGRFRVEHGRPVEPVGFERELPEYARAEAGAAGLGALDALAQGSPTGDVVREGELVYPSDFAYFKPRTDVLLRATCHAPRGSKVTEQTVGFGVGSFHKRLRVVGPRVWVDRVLGGKKTDPLPFSSLPLGYRGAYGGPGYPDNPLGVGHDSRGLAHVEHLDRDSSASTGPAGFGPVHPDWPARAQKRGTRYGADWLERRAPELAEDFDFAYFNAAPHDQQLEGPLRGDEELRLEGLHPDHARLTCRLPSLRPRVFLQDVDGRRQAIHMRLDTLLVELDERPASEGPVGVVTLTWRGVGEARRDDLSDLAFALVAVERLGDEPLADERYFAELGAFAEDPVGLRKVFPGGLDEAKAVASRADDEAPAVDPSSPEAIDALLASRLGSLGERERLALRAQLEAAVASMPREAQERASASAKGGAAPPRAHAGAGQGGARASLGAALKPLFDGLAAALSKADGKGAGESGGGDAKALEAARALPRDPRLTALDPGLAAGAGQDEPGPGADLRGRDLSGLDLRGRDLSGADLEGALLTKADLTGAKLTGAKLAFAVLYKATLEGASLEGADLTSAELSLVRAEGADLSKAKLDFAVLRKAVLTRARLRGASATMAHFVEADLTRLDADGVTLDKVSFDECALDRASFCGATLTSTSFYRCRAPYAALRGARLDGTGFHESTVDHADLTEAVGVGVSFLKSNLEGADLSWATLLDAQLSECLASDAKLVACNLREARFFRAVLRGCDFSQANLFSADLRQTMLTRARFSGANLYDAKLMESAGTGVDFRGARLGRASFLRSQVVRL